MTLSIRSTDSNPSPNNPVIMTIIRGLAGVIMGITYGVLVSALVFLLTRPDLVKPGSGLLIMLDPAALAWLGVWISGIIAGVCAALVGLVVGLANLGKRKAAIMGCVTGVLVIVFGSIAFGSFRYTSTLRDWITLFVTIAILPGGLALVGIVVAIVGDKLNLHFS